MDEYEKHLARLGFRLVSVGGWYCNDKGHMAHYCNKRIAFGKIGHVDINRWVTCCPIPANLFVAHAAIRGTMK